MTDHDIPLRRAWVDIDLEAIRHNARILAALCAPAQVCAVVKADGYGHCALSVATAAIEGGATRLAVALVEEGRALRMAGITVPILLLSEPAPDAMEEVVAHGLIPTIYTHAGVTALAKAARREEVQRWPLHVKVDTGMHRVGAAPGEVLALLQAVDECSELETQGLYTHLAIADDPSDEFTRLQLQRFHEVAEEVDRHGLLPSLLHAANSAAAIEFPESRLSMVRCGAALYGFPPSSHVALPEGIRPAMSVRAEVSMVKLVDPGETISYGRHWKLDEQHWVATLPVGYADGVPRRLADHQEGRRPEERRPEERRGEVLVGGQRFPIAGSVTMDQLMVDMGRTPVAVGDEVVLLGSQGDQHITASDWAEYIGSIPYEVVCRIGPRLPRRFRNA